MRWITLSVVAAALACWPILGFADGLDDSWVVCAQHRLQPSPRPRPPYAEGFERCIEIEKLMQPRLDAAQAERNRQSEAATEAERRREADHTAVLDWVFPTPK